MLDYYQLKLVWWGLIGVLLIGFAIMDGHDMGVGMLLPFLGKTDTERRVMINTIAPHWDGNQVWFVTAGGAVFAAWPFVYAIAFSGLYWAMLLLLSALFFRPVGFEYRSKLTSAQWRNNWDWAIFAGSAVPSLLFGVAFGNLFRGVPFELDENMRASFTGSFFDLLNPFALLCGLVSVSLLVLQGASFLAHRTDAAVQQRAKSIARVAAFVLLVGFSVAGVMVWQMDGMTVVKMGDKLTSLNPMMKTVQLTRGGWLHNFTLMPMLWLIPATVYAMVIATVALQSARRTLVAFVTMSVAVAAMILTAGVALFPFVLPSLSHPNMSLTLRDAASSRYTLNVMFWAALILTPIVLLYTSWAYRVMRGTVSVEYVQANDKGLY